MKQFFFSLLALIFVYLALFPLEKGYAQEAPLTISQEILTEILSTEPVEVIERHFEEFAALDLSGVSPEVFKRFRRIPLVEMPVNFRYAMLLSVPLYNLNFKTISIPFEMIQSQGIRQLIRNKALGVMNSRELTTLKSITPTPFPPLVIEVIDGLLSSTTRG